MTFFEPWIKNHAYSLDSSVIGAHRFSFLLKPVWVRISITCIRKVLSCYIFVFGTGDVWEQDSVQKRKISKSKYWKDLHDQDNHDGVITHLEPDILECEVKWALESITTNKASGGDGIPVELFQILKDDAVKVLHSICQQIWKTQQWPQDWKRSVFIRIPKKHNDKECSN